MRELTRVRQYVAKIKTAQAAVPEPAATLDKDAANRFIKAALAGNDKYDAARAETQARERAGAEAKLAALNAGGRSEVAGPETARPAVEESSEEDEKMLEGLEDEESAKDKAKKRKPKAAEAEEAGDKKVKKSKKSKVEKEAKRALRKGVSG